MPTHTIEIDVPHELIGGAPPTRDEVAAAIQSVKLHYPVAWCEDQSLSWFDIFHDRIAVRLHTVSRSESERSICNTSKQRERVCGEIVGYLRCSRAVHIRESTRVVDGASVVRTDTGYEVRNLVISDESDAAGVYDVCFVGPQITQIRSQLFETLHLSSARAAVVAYRARTALKQARS